ncbi:MAG: hypothetical protein Q8M95_06045 [Candidatus Methanoperedens sp.]|nr:hypothetical protein [Candidatus Methanoperedens sp.]
MQIGMMDGYGYGMGSGVWIFGLIFWILILIGLVLLIKYLWEGGAKKEERPAIKNSRRFFELKREVSYG